MSGETEDQVSGWTVDTLRDSMQRQLNQMSATIDDRLDFLVKALDERYATQTKANDAAFAAQQTAMQAAFTAQQTAMQTAFTAADKAVAAALESAEKAVTKAEVAAEKRFEAVNEFRGQLADQAATLMTRTEADIRFTALTEKADTLTGSNRQRIEMLERQMTEVFTDRRATATAVGIGASTEANRRNQMIAFASVVVAVIAIAAGILVALKP